MVHSSAARIADTYHQSNVLLMKRVYSLWHGLCLQSMRMAIENAEQYTASLIVCVEEAASHADKADKSILVTHHIF